MIQYGNIVKAKYNIFDFKTELQDIARVIHMEDSLYGILIQYDYPVINGHDGGGIGKQGCCLWQCESNLVRI